MYAKSNRVKRRFGRSKATAPLTGFTLLETLVALILIVSAIVGPFTLATRGIFNAKFAKNKLVALNLAQEGMEIVRHLRDTNVINGNDWRGLSCPVPAVCSRIDDGEFNVDASNSLPGQANALQGGVITPLLSNPATGLFDRQSGDATSPSFTRTVAITSGAQSDPEVPTADQMMVVVTVQWSESGVNRDISLRELFYNWR